MAQGGKKPKSAKAKSAGAMRKQEGITKKGMRVIKPKQHHLTAALKTQADISKDINASIETSLASKSGDHSFKVITPDPSKTKEALKAKRRGHTPALKTKV
eukprot:m.24164 g.24164  ORF g.24164 m.24164 type:complete len:101 (-) comp9526_c0_seq1:86-388(-)